MKDRLRLGLTLATAFAVVGLAGCSPPQSDASAAPELVDAIRGTDMK